MKDEPVQQPSQSQGKPAEASAIPKDVFNRLYTHARDLKFKQEFQRQLEYIMERERRNSLGDRITLSGSKSQSRLFQ